MAQLKETINRINDEIEKNKLILETLYSDRLDRTITKERYIETSNSIEEKIKLLQEDLETSQQTYNDLQNTTIDKQINYAKKVKEFLSFENPTKELLSKIIERIDVGENKKIFIRYRIKEMNLSL